MNLFHDNLHLRRLNPGDALDVGRGQKVFSQHIDSFEAKRCKHMDDQSALNSAMAVDPARMSLPTRVALVDPIDILPADRARIFQDRHLSVNSGLDNSFEITLLC